MPERWFAAAVRAAAFTFAFFCGSELASANGRFPAANQLVIDPADAEHLLLRATYGLLASHDGGESFSWICEDVLGDVGESDPAVAILRGGQLVVAAGDRLMLSDAGACALTDVLDAGSSDFPVDVSLDQADDAVALAVARSGDGSGDVHLLEISGNSTVARVVGASLGNDLFPLTLDGAPSAPERIYVTALSMAPASVLLRSDDRGQSWQRFQIHPYEKLQAYLAAVDPNDADTLYLRVNDDPADHLLVSSDAGEHFVEVSGLDTKLLGFALSPDGNELAVGGPGAPLRLANSAELKFAVAGAPFAQLSCLKWAAGGLFACADDRADGFTLGLSPDSGTSFAPLFHARELGPLSCDAGTSVGASCPRVWSGVAMQVGAGPAAAQDDGGVSTTPTGTAPPRRAGSCGIAPQRSPGSNGLFAATAVLFALARARRRGLRARCVTRLRWRCRPL